MEKTFTVSELLEVINNSRRIDEQPDYLLSELISNIEDEEIVNCEKITAIQAVGLFAYQDHFVRMISTKEILKETHMTVSDFCKQNEIEMEFGEIVAVSKLCQKISDKEFKEVKTKINNNRKEVKMFDVYILKKVMKLN